ncbi:MAG: undecaprenyl phosphate translocase family protein, partial [Canibacter sp.]
MQATPGNQSDETPQATEQIAHTVERKTSIVGNFVRGALIGTVETVPGVSGGTVALVVGIYHQIIDSA